MGLNLNYTADVLVSTEDMQEETLINLADNQSIIIRPDG